MTPLAHRKCPNMIKPRFTKKTKKRVADKRAAIYSTTHPLFNPLPDTHERCNGNLSVTVEAVDTPNWGGSYAELEITVHCDTCGTAYLMPHDTTVEAWAEHLISDALDANSQAQETPDV